MDGRMRYRWSRRELLGGMSAAGTAGLLGVQGGSSAAEPLPETTRVRLARFRSICRAPQYVAEEFFRAEGFTDVQYIRTTGGLLLRRGRKP